MSIIDPDSPRQHGHDISGNPVELGDTDSDGYLVGWIDEKGSAWESAYEHDIAVTAGEYREAWRAWALGGALLGHPEPDPEEFAERICVEASSIEPAIHEAIDAIECPFLGLRIAIMVKAMRSAVIN